MSDTDENSEPIPAPEPEVLTLKSFSFLGESILNGWQRLLRFNVLYLFSALLMLSGCYLISQPFLNLHRTLADLLTLFGTINVYEVLVLGALIFILRKLPKSRETNLLLLIALLFWLDVTFTVNATIPEHFGAGLIACAGSFAFVCAKMFALEAGSRAPVFAGVRVILLGACLFLYSFQTVLVLHQEQTIWDGAGYLVFLVWGLLPLCWLRAPAGAIEEDAPTPLVDLDHLEFAMTGKRPPPPPWWQRFSFKRTVAWIALAICGVHLFGQAWVHQTPMRPDFFAPLGLALLAAAPAWFGRKLEDSARITLALAWLGLLIWSEPLTWNSPVGLWSTLRFNLAMGAVTCGLLFYLERKIVLCDGIFLLSALAVLGATRSEQLSSFIAPSLLALSLLILLCSAWLGFVGHSRTRVVLGSLLLLWLTSHGLRHCGMWKHVELEYARLVPLLLLTLATYWRLHAGWRLAGMALCFYLGARGCASDGLTDLFYFYLTAPVLAYAAGRLNKHALWPALAAYALSGNIARFGVPSFRGEINSGWLIIAGAFGVFGLALLVTKLQVKQRA